MDVNISSGQREGINRVRIHNLESILNLRPPRGLRHLLPQVVQVGREQRRIQEHQLLVGLLRRLAAHGHLFLIGKGVVDGLGGRRLLGAQRQADEHEQQKQCRPAA